MTLDKLFSNVTSATVLDKLKPLYVLGHRKLLDMLPGKTFYHKFSSDTMEKTFSGMLNNKYLVIVLTVNWEGGCVSCISSCRYTELWSRAIATTGSA